MALNNITNNTIPRLQSSMTLPICQEHRRVRNLPLVGTLPLTSSLVSIISAFVIFPVTLLLNVLVIIAFYKNNPILQKKANIFLGAIAVNDLIRGCIGGPLFIAREIRYQYKLEPNCYLTSVFATVLINAVSELLVTALNFERFLSVKYPVCHRTRVRKQHLNISILVSFTLGIGLAVVRNYRIEGRFPFFLFYIASYLATSVLSIMIWWEILSRTRRMKKRVHGESALEGSKNSTENRQPSEITGKKCAEFKPDDIKSQEQRGEISKDDNKLKFNDQVKTTKKSHIYRAEDENISTLPPKEKNIKHNIIGVDEDDQHQTKIQSSSVQNTSNKEQSKITSKEESAGITIVARIEDDQVQGKIGLNLAQNTSNKEQCKITSQDESVVVAVDDDHTQAMGSHPAPDTCNRETTKSAPNTEKAETDIFVLESDHSHAKSGSNSPRTTSDDEKLKLASSDENPDNRVVVVEDGHRQVKMESDPAQNTGDNERGKKVQSKEENFEVHVIVIERKSQTDSNSTKKAGDKERSKLSLEDISTDVEASNIDRIKEKNGKKLKNENDTGRQNEEIPCKSDKPEIQVHEPSQSKFLMAKQIHKIAVQKDCKKQTQLKRAKQASSWEIVHDKSVKTTTYLALALFFTRFIPLMLFFAVLIDLDWIHIAVPVVHTLFLTNALVNPLIYGVMNRDIRKACIRLIKCQ